MKRFGLKILSPLVYVIAAILSQAPALLLAQTPEQTEQLQQKYERKKEEKRSLEEQRNLIIQKEQGVFTETTGD